MQQQGCGRARECVSCTANTTFFFLKANPHIITNDVVCQSPYTRVPLSTAGMSTAGMSTASDASCAPSQVSDGWHPPPHLVCPISRDVFERPVTIPATGMTFDEAPLLNWLAISQTCPLTRTPVSADTLVLNKKLCDQVSAWKRAHGYMTQVSPGHPGDCAPSSPRQLVEALSQTTRQRQCIALLQRLQETAWHSEASKMHIAHAGGIPTLLKHIIPTTTTTEGCDMEAQWHAAEVLSLLALVDTLRDDILDTIVPPTATDDSRQQRLDAALRTHLTALKMPPNGNTNTPRVLWMIWLLSLDARLRAAAIQEPTLVPLLAAALPRRDATSFAALRVVRSLALVDAVGALHTGGVVAATVALLATTDRRACAPSAHGDGVATERMLAMAACSALCNATSSHHGAPADPAMRADAMRCAQSMLCTTDNPHVQGWAARLVRVVGIAWTNGWQLCKEAGVLPPLLHMLQGPLDMTRVTACSALHALTEASPAARADMAREGAVTLLAAAAKSQHYPLRFMAARTMAELACPAASGAFRCPSVAAALEHLLQDGCEHCQYCATVCLLNTSAAADPGASCLVLQHVEAATMRGLLRLLSASSAHYRCASAAVLRQLVRVEANRPYMVKVGVVHALLDVVVHDAGRNPMEAAGALQHLARMGSFYRNAVMDAAQAAGKVPGGMLDGLVGQLYTSRSS